MRKLIIAGVFSTILMTQSAVAVLAPAGLFKQIMDSVAPLSSPEELRAAFRGFLQQEPELASMKDATRQTLLMKLAACGNAPALKMWLELTDNAQINEKNIDGYTVLHLSAKLENYECAQILIDAGADIHAPTAQGETPFHIAALSSSQNGHSGFLWRVILSKGADPSAILKNGDNILHAAIRCSEHSNFNKLYIELEKFLAPKVFSDLCRQVNKDGDNPLRMMEYFFTLADDSSFSGEHAPRPMHEDQESTPVAGQAQTPLGKMSPTLFSAQGTPLKCVRPVPLKSAGLNYPIFNN